MDDIYNDLKNLVEKTHTALVLEKNKKKEYKNIKLEIKKEIENKKSDTHEIKKNTQSCQTTTTKTTEPEKYIYVSQPPAGRKGTKTDSSIINWSRSLRGYYFF